MAGQKTSPKLLALTKWKRINEVNEKLDSGVTPAEVHKFINKSGFSISKPLIYDYARMRRQLITQDIVNSDMVSLITPSKAEITRIPILTAHEMHTPEYKENKQRIRNELQALDWIIERGYETLQDFADKPMSPKTMMEAISLKDRITGGGHMHLTEYGMQNLREVENKKYQLVINLLMRFVPEDLHAAAIEAIDQTEDDFYKRTAYYEDYLRVQGHTDEEIYEIMERVKESDLHGEVMNKE